MTPIETQLIITSTRRIFESYSANINANLALPHKVASAILNTDAIRFLEENATNKAFDIFNNKNLNQEEKLLKINQLKYKAMEHNASTTNPLNKVKYCIMLSYFSVFTLLIKCKTRHDNFEHDVFALKHMLSIMETWHPKIKDILNIHEICRHAAIQLLSPRKNLPETSGIANTTLTNHERLINNAGQDTSMFRFTLPKINTAKSLWEPEPCTNQKHMQQQLGTLNFFKTYTYTPTLDAMNTRVYKYDNPKAFAMGSIHKIKIIKENLRTMSNEDLIHIFESVNRAGMPRLNAHLHQEYEASLIMDLVGEMHRRNLRPLIRAENGIPAAANSAPAASAPITSQPAGNAASGTINMPETENDRAKRPKPSSI